MTSLTPQQLWRILDNAAGQPDPVQEPGQDPLDTPFEDLGYDSLALLQLAVGIELECGIEIAEGQLPRLTTPRAMMAFVNGQCPAS